LGDGALTPQVGEKSIYARRATPADPRCLICSQPGSPVA